MNSNRASGFTLLEMTIVLVLVAMISLVIIEGLRFGGRVYAQVVKVDDADWSVFVAQRFLRGVLESAYPFDPERANGAAFGLEGTTTHLSFSALASRINGPGALDRYDVFVAGDSVDAHRLNLLVSRRIDRDGRPDPGEGEGTEVLVENVARVEWTYFGIPCDAPGAWQNVWQGRHDLPSLLRMRVVFPKGDPRQWPDLIVAPRITDDAISWLYKSNTPNRVCGSS
jgi:general secretion pathway protein J